MFIDGGGAGEAARAKAGLSGRELSRAPAKLTGLVCGIGWGFVDFGGGGLERGDCGSGLERLEGFGGVLGWMTIPGLVGKSAVAALGFGGWMGSGLSFKLKEMSFLTTGKLDNVSFFGGVAGTGLGGVAVAGLGAGVETDKEVSSFLATIGEGEGSRIGRIGLGDGLGLVGVELPALTSRAIFSMDFWCVGEMGLEGLRRRSVETRWVNDGFFGGVSGFDFSGVVGADLTGVVGTDSILAIPGSGTDIFLTGVAS